MKRSTIITALAMAMTALVSNTVQAQTAFVKGTTAFNLGIGLGGTRYSYINSYNDNYTVSPTIIVNGEHGVGELGPGTLGIGGFIGHKSVRYDYTSNSVFSNYTYHYDQKWTNTLIGLRGSWHPNEFFDNEKVDLYGGVMLGYNVGSYKNNTTRTLNGVTTSYDDGFGYKTSYVTWSTYIGGRYFFTQKIGAYLELGYGVSYINLGLSIKF